MLPPRFPRMSAKPVAVPTPGAASGEAAVLIFPLLALALGHMISTMLRTLPAISGDVMSSDLGVSAEQLAGAVGIYHFAFAAGQIPVGVALDRFGVKRVALTLLAMACLGSVFAAVVQGQMGLIVSQVVLGLGCCGMLLCPMTLAAKTLTPARFGMWSGVVQSVGNAGMLISASPLAWLVENVGWRAGFWAAAIFSVLVFVLVTLVVPGFTRGQGERPPRLLAELREVLRISVAPRLRGVIILSFASFAAMIAIRGLWGGPWLMQIKDMTRIAAGHSLLLFTLALTFGPLIFGMVDRRLGRRRGLIIAGHACAIAALLLIAGGAPGGWLSAWWSTPMLPAGFDTAMFVFFGLSISVQPLLFALGRDAVDRAHAGKALSAVNLSFFVGAAVIQSSTGPIASGLGLPAVLMFIAAVVAVCTVLFAVYAPKPGSGAA